MTALAVDQPIAAAPGDPWGRGSRRCWRVLLAGWLALAGITLAVGERHTSVADLEQALRSGQLHQVEMTRTLGPRDRGYTTVEIHWRTGLVAHWAELLQARPRRAAPPPSQRSASTRVVTEDPAVWVHRFDPDVRVGPYARAGTYSELAGWRLQGWPQFLWLGLILSTLFAITSLPRPRRATRWAWFWLVTIAAPVGLPAYLLLGGPTHGVLAPRPGAKRLTGGFAFLLALVIGAMVHGS